MAQFLSVMPSKILVWKKEKRLNALKLSCSLLALAIVLAEVLDSYERDVQIPFLFLMDLFALGVILVVSGFAPRVAGVIYIVIFVLSAFAGATEIFAFPVLGVYLIVGIWIVEFDIISGVIVLVAVEGMLIFLSDVPVSQLSGAAVSSGLVLGVSFILRAWRLKNKQALESAQVAKAQAEEAGERVRSELASQLHDTTAKDLAQIAMVAQQLSRQEHVTPDELSSLARLASSAAKRIRPTILNLDSMQSRTNIAETVSLVAKMLFTRGILLERDIDEGVDSCITRQQSLLASLVIREACTNILKYAKAGSNASLVVSLLDDESVSISVSNEVADDGEIAGVTGGFGLANLGL